jgi:hypothetical protein
MTEFAKHRAHGTKRKCRFQVSGNRFQFTVTRPESRMQKAGYRHRNQRHIAFSFRPEMGIIEEERATPCLQKDPKVNRAL